MSAELQIWSDLLGDHGLTGWLGLAAVAATLFAVGFAAVAGARMGTTRGRVMVLGPAVLLTLGCVGPLLVLTALLRDRALGMILGTVEPGWFGFGFTLAQEQLCLALLGPLFVLAIPLTVVALARTARKGRALGYAAAFVSLVTGVLAWLAVGATRDALIVGFHSMSGSRPSALLDVSAWIDLAPAFVVTAAVVALSGVLVVRRRTRERFGRRATVGAGLVFVLGALAFVGTRGHAEDRRHPASLLGDHVSSSYRVHPAPGWMEGRSCVPLEIAPVIELTDGLGARLDNRFLLAAGLRRDLMTYRRNWVVLHMREPFPGLVTVFAPLDMSAVRLQEWLSVVHEAGYFQVQLAFARPEGVRTSMLGEVEVTRHCAVHAHIGPCSPKSRVPMELQTVEMVVREIYEGRGDAIHLPYTSCGIPYGCR